MIQLIPFTERDIDGLIKEIDSPQLMMQWSGRAYSYPLTKEQLERYLEMEQKKGSYIYKAVDPLSNETVGHIALREIDHVHELGRISYVLVYKKYRGKGMAKQMFHQVLPFAFDELQLNRVSLGVFDFNKAAITCYERLGFKREGIHRQVCKLNDSEYWNNVEMALLREEWEAQNERIKGKAI
ncbi:hypothetical protein AC623_11860 [Bacillus sp. FJAT-27231]|uniref:GNAT family N-acetyltransferase n=1 Tax=Bacillus sp. FJAT-27231 TaxID=1679168 RepID=UPI0006717AA0|nr:GNAT family protein [Bacillus sp. FJAT-27231]KMY54523.1 hypothetical protein AC623_11860 [Bacillus sp. FJAT-27231]